MNLTAKVVPWSSVVGTGLMLMNESGRCIAQLMPLNISTEITQDELKDFSLALMNAVADAINAAQEGR